MPALIHVPILNIYYIGMTWRGGYNSMAFVTVLECDVWG